MRLILFIFILMKKVSFLLLFIGIALFCKSQPISIFLREGRSVFLTGTNRELFRVTPYGRYIIRIQVSRVDEDFFPDNRYEMVETHDWPGNLKLVNESKYYQMTTDSRDGISVKFNKLSNYFTFSSVAEHSTFLEGLGFTWVDDSIRAAFRSDPAEHFSGLGHGYFGREESIDLRGKRVSRNYGKEHGQQAPLIVPFYLSSKGYGVFLNSTFPNTFNFGKDGKYEFSIYGDGRMDFFVILGPKFSDIIDRYTQLTGRPFLPPKAFFGLALSDKGNDHNSPDSSDENWWKRKITEHRAAGFPIDHVVNDNRWRAGGGQRCLSYFDWDKTRYPDPVEYANWLRSNGLITTLDLNRCIAARSDGWKSSFNIPDATGIDFNTSAPDLTKKEVRDWFWDLMWRKSLNPKLGYPCDALWIDEFDEMGKASPQMTFTNGSTWMEMRNYWFYLIAKSLVQDGWNKNFIGTKRPFVWVRGMTAGAQRYATLWSGDIKCSYDDMKMQVRALQLAGLSGFPFWGHDAGGFYDYALQRGPTDSMYMQWSMAFGSFTPFWKPHGVGKSRWPLDRPIDVQKDAKLYSELRYKLIPYIYTYAHLAKTTGIPIARAMIIDHEDEAAAWTHDLQYMWGRELLIAPNCSDIDNTVSVWLPKGQWYDFWNGEKFFGNRIIKYPSPLGKLPLFVRSGSIIPMAPFALSTAFISRDSLTLHVFIGDNGKFTLYEDDGVSEAYRVKNESRITTFTFSQSSLTLKIEEAVGNYKDAPGYKNYRVDFHGFDKEPAINANVVIVNAAWDKDKKVFSLILEKTMVSNPIEINCRY